jgi:hypothetical protein
MEPGIIAQLSLVALIAPFRVTQMSSPKWCSLLSLGVKRGLESTGIGKEAFEIDARVHALA